MSDEASNPSNRLHNPWMCMAFNLSVFLRWLSLSCSLTCLCNSISICDFYVQAITQDLYVEILAIFGSTIEHSNSNNNVFLTKTFISRMTCVWVLLLLCKLISINARANRLKNDFQWLGFLSTVIFKHCILLLFFLAFRLPIDLLRLKTISKMIIRY